jgi:hypothetical protein
MNIRFHHPATPLILKKRYWSGKLFQNQFYYSVQYIIKLDNQKKYIYTIHKLNKVSYGLSGVTRILKGKQAGGIPAQYRLL